MREMYQNEAEVSPSSPDPTKEVNLNADPFYDRFPWYAMKKKKIFKTIQPQIVLQNLGFAWLVVPWFTCQT